MSLLKSTLLSLLTLLAVIACCYLFPAYIDTTAHKVNELNQSSKVLLNKLNSTLQLDIYTTNAELLHETHELLNKYNSSNKHIKIAQHHGSLTPEQRLKFGLSNASHIVSTYNNVSKAIDIPTSGLNEERLSNFIHQTISNAEKWIVFTSGHGERDPFSTENNGLHKLRLLLLDEGFQVISLDLTQQQTIPDNTALIVLANPTNEPLAATKNLLLNYIDNGGSLVWLTSPQLYSNFDFLADHLKLKLKPGFLWDSEGLGLGSPHGAISVITEFPQHAITEQLKSIAILPWSTVIDASLLTQANKTKGFNWQLNPLIYAPKNSFLVSSTEEVKSKQKAPQNNSSENNIITEDDKAKDKSNASQTYQHQVPAKHLTHEKISISLNRNIPGKTTEQRLIITGNIDFLSNAYINSYGNTSLATKVFHWLTFEDLLLPLETNNPTETSFIPTRLHSFLANYLFTIILPLVFLSISVLIYRQAKFARWS